MKITDVYVVFSNYTRANTNIKLCGSDSAMLEVVQKLMKENWSDWHDYYTSPFQMLEEIERESISPWGWCFGTICVKIKEITY